MKKQKIIEVFVGGQEEFLRLLDKLSLKQIQTIPVTGNWTTKEVIAHLSAWNWEQANEIGRILECKPTWNNPKYLAYDDDKFNKLQVDKRKDMSVDELIEELKKSFDFLIKKIKDLSKDEWNYECDGKFWPDGEKMTIQSLFPYEAKGISDAGSHAKEIKNRLGL